MTETSTTTSRQVVGVCIEKGSPAWNALYEYAVTDDTRSRIELQFDLPRSAVMVRVDHRGWSEPLSLLKPEAVSS